MTNYEKFKDNIIGLLATEIGIDKYTGEPDWCDSLNCNDCLSNCQGDYMREWLNAEYEPPKDDIELATLIAYLKQEPNQMKRVKSIKIVDGVPVINGGD